MGPTCFNSFVGPGDAGTRDGRQVDSGTEAYAGPGSGTHDRSGPDTPKRLHGAGSGRHAVPSRDRAGPGPVRVEPHECSTPQALIPVWYLRFGFAHRAMKRRGVAVVAAPNAAEAQMQVRRATSTFGWSAFTFGE